MDLIVQLLGVFAPLAQIVGALLGAYLVALWLTLIIWTFRDVETRSRSLVTQIFATLLALFFFLPGVLLYFILRPKETLDEVFQRSLQEEYLLQDLEELPLCPSCRRLVHADYVLCPHCHTQLRENCPNCQRLVELRWDICPFCTTPLPSSDETVATLSTLGPAALPAWVSPALETLRQRVASLRERYGSSPPALTGGSRGTTTAGRRPEVATSADEGTAGGDTEAVPPTDQSPADPRRPR